MSPQTFLVEIGTEELPAQSLRLLAETFASQFAQVLQHAGLAHGAIHWFATPRRLALKVLQLADRQPDKLLEKRGPALTQAFDVDGQPTIAAQKWAQSCQITLAQAQQRHTDQGSWLLHRATVTGTTSQLLLPELVEQALKNSTHQKLMHWGDHPTPFVRPVHRVILLFGAQLIEGSVLGIATSRTLLGHRFMGESEITLEQADHYPQILQERGRVIADYATRQSQIRSDIAKAATALGGHADLDEELLEEVTALVEWPVILTATFDPQFLVVPAAALVHTMKKDQRYFPVYDQHHHLLPCFIFVANIATADPSAIIHGNEKVIRPRLADAQFFFDSDRQQPLINYLPRLADMLFQQRLGTLRDKAYRLQKLSGLIAAEIGASSSDAARAGLLAKCDLASSMVFEFPETQGAMGMHYACQDGEPAAVAEAIQQHYWPRFAADGLPTSPVSCAVALADKLDTLVGIIGIGAHPTGDKDPFALRRAALGILRILLANPWPLDLKTIVAATVALYGSRLSNLRVATEVVDFILARLQAWYQEQGVNSATVQAVLSRPLTVPIDIDARIKAVAHFYTLPAANGLAAANKRVSHLLAKCSDDLPSTLNEDLLLAAAEQLLAQQLRQLQQLLPPLLAVRDYPAALGQLARLHPTVEAFFAEVLVMVEDRALCHNRLKLLQEVQALFLQIADISLLSVQRPGEIASAR